MSKRNNPNNFLLASLLVSLNRGIVLKKKAVTHVISKFLKNILIECQKKKIISGFCIKNKLVYIYLKYDSFGNCIIKKMILISKPGSKKYMNNYMIKTTLKKNPVALYILSTNKGILDIHLAFKLKIGGELLFQIII